MPLVNADGSATRTRRAARQPIRAVQPALLRRFDHLVQVQEIRHSLAHHRRTQQTFASRLSPNGDRFLDDIHNLIDDHSHTVFAIVEDNHLHGIGGRDAVQIAGH